MRKVIFLAIFLLGLAHCHSSVGPLREAFQGQCSQDNPAPIQSWHIHILYWQNNQENMAGALQIRENFIEHFKDILGDNYSCGDDEERDNRLCVYDGRFGPVGPFLTAQWCGYIPLEHFDAVISWGLQNRKNYDVLFHPNTGCELEDHSWWALWAGQAWQLDLSIFKRHSHLSNLEKEKMLAEHQERAENESPLIKLFNKSHKN